MPIRFGDAVKHVIFKNKEAKAWIYIDQRTAKVGTPRPGYLEKIIYAAKKFDFPEKYIAHLESFLPRPNKKV